MKNHKIISVSYLRNHLGEVVDMVYFKDMEIIIRKNKKLVALLSRLNDKFNPPVFHMGGKFK